MALMSETMKHPVTSLAGQLLIAMPQMQDRRFTRSVIFLCAHNEEGAMGLVVNKVIDTVTLPELLEKLGIPSLGLNTRRPVHAGGPVEEGRGFVLHSDDYREDNTLVVGSMGLTATLDILRAIGRGQGPRRSMLALGYAGWGPGQLDTEMSDNGWLHVPADEAIVFDEDIADKWQRALGKLGIDPLSLSGEAGHA
jgi:putative transcriptional regulator